MPVYSYETPTTGIPAAFAQLAASNSAIVQRQMEMDAISRQQAQSRSAMTGALIGAAGAAAIVATGGAATPAVIAAAGVGASAGSIVGRARAGGPVDQSAVLQTGLQAAAVGSDIAQTSSERDLISGVQASRATAAAANNPMAASPDAGIGGPGSGAPPAQVDPMSAEVDRILAASKTSPNPLKTASTALGFLRSLNPPLTTTVAKPGDVLLGRDASGRVVSSLQVPAQEKAVVVPAGSNVVGFTPGAGAASGALPAPAGQAAPAPVVPAPSAAAPAAPQTPPPPAPAPAPAGGGLAPTPAAAPIQETGPQPLLVRKDEKSPWQAVTGDPAVYAQRYGDGNVQRAPLPNAPSASAPSPTPTSAAPSSAPLPSGVRMLAQGGKEHPSTAAELAAIGLPADTKGAQTDATGKISILPGDRAASYMERNKNQVVQQYLSLPSSRELQAAVPHMEVIMEGLKGTTTKEGGQTKVEHSIAQDQNMVYALMKIRNPSSQVTLEEAKSGSDVGSLIATGTAKLFKLAGTGKMTQVMREDVATAAHDYLAGRITLNAQERQATMAKLAAPPYSSPDPARDVPPMAFQSLEELSGRLNAAKIEGRGGGSVPVFATEAAAGEGFAKLKSGQRYIGPDGVPRRKP